MFSEPTQLELDLRDVVPLDWELIGGLQPLNIDGDPDQEFILLYHYDHDQNGRAPIGAVAYDLQLDSAFTTGGAPEELIPIPNQPAGFYIPYRILPNYWQSAVGISSFTTGDSYLPIGQFIAPPGTDISAISFTPISRGNVSEDGEAIVDEMVIQGGSTHLTVIWWKSAYDGYGVVQLHAPYGFSNLNWGETSATIQSPLLSVVGSFPQNDRSRLCRKILYSRQESEIDRGIQGINAAITYIAASLGIRFCDGIPVDPFYPEGVVLAYLLSPSDHLALVQSPSDDPDETAALRDLIDSRIVHQQLEEGIERIEVIETRAALPYPPRVPGGAQTILTTNVCVEILSQGGESRQLRFLLRYIPANLSQRTTDRWAIIEVNTQDRSNDQFTCRQFIQMRPPT